jgi:hypothetical protein
MNMIARSIEAPTEALRFVVKRWTENMLPREERRLQQQWEVLDGATGQVTLDWRDVPLVEE